MMGGAGHMQDMINKIKANKAQRNSRKETRNKLKNLDSKKDKSELSFKKVTQQELNTIINKNRAKAKKERRNKNIITFLIFVPIFILVMYYLRKSLYMTLK